MATWKNERPDWCPHPDCKFKMNSQNLICTGKLPKSEPHGKDERIHPTQKPVLLFEYLIKTYTNEEMIVLDCFAGSMTTAIACLNTGRNYICIEQEEEMYNKAKERIAKYEQEQKSKLF